MTLLNNVLAILMYGTLLAFTINVICNNYISIIKTDVSYVNIKLILLFALSLSFTIYIFFIYNYYVFYYNNSCYFLFINYNIVPKIFQKTFFFFEFSIDFFGIVVLFLAYFVGILSLLALDNRIFWKNTKYFFFFNYFVLLVFFFVFSTNVLLLFLFYELLLVPSFLVVYFISPSRRSIQASLYFLI